MRRQSTRRTPSTASTASGTVTPLKACSGLALSPVADSRYTNSAASGQVLVAAARKLRGRPR